MSEVVRLDAPYCEPWSRGKRERMAVIGAYVLFVRSSGFWEFGIQDSDGDFEVIGRGKATNIDEAQSTVNRHFKQHIEQLLALIPTSEVQP